MKKALKKVTEYIKEYGILKFIKKVAKKILRKDVYLENYDEWRRARLITEDEIRKQKEEEFSYQPKYSFVIPLYQTPENYLEELIQSIQNQTYGNWEICLSDGGGNSSLLREVLQKYKADEKIKIRYSEKQLDISRNTNQAIEMAEGDYIVFTDHDDILPVDALYECTKVLNEDRSIDLIYSDEDKITMDGKKYFQPHFKPDFNIDLLRSMNYFCHLVVVKKTLQEKVGTLNSEFDGAQDYDFVLRCVEQAGKIHHIPKVLYHWRAHKGSVAGNVESKRYAFDAGQKALEAHYQRCGLEAEVVPGEIAGIYHTKYKVVRDDKVSIIIPNKDHIDDLDRCLRSIKEKTKYKYYEILIVENNSEDSKTFEYYKKLEKEESNLKVLYYEGGFNYSKINNYAVKRAEGVYCLLLNNDTEVITEGWIEQMVGLCQRADVGAVGVKLFYPNKTVQHAGIIVGYRNAAAHAFIGNEKGEPGYFARSICAQDYSAVTAACMMVKKEVFTAVGGFDEEFKVAYNDVDLSMKITALGKLVVYDPDVQLWHYESKSRGSDESAENIARFESEKRRLYEKWKDFFENGDPNYNPNLTLEKTLFTLR